MNVNKKHFENDIMSLFRLDYKGNPLPNVTSQGFPL